MSRYPNHHYDYESESEDEYSEPKYTHQQQQHQLQGGFEDFHYSYRQNFQGIQPFEFQDQLYSDPIEHIQEEIELDNGNLDEEFECCGAREEEYNNELDSTFFSNSINETYLEDQKNAFVFDVGQDDSFFEKRLNIWEENVNMDIDMQNSQQVYDNHVKNTAELNHVQQCQQQEQKVPQEVQQKVDALSRQKQGRPVKHQKRPTKYYNNFDFIHKRTIFRAVTVFFKNAFKPYLDSLKKRHEEFTPAGIQQILIEFSQEFFPQLLESFETKNQSVDFLEHLKLLIFAQRFNKNDAFLSNPIVPFDVVRNPCYKYNKQAEATFLSFPVYSFLIACFSLSQKGQNFMQQQLTGKDIEDLKKMQLTLQSLTNDAIMNLRSTKGPLAEKLNSYLGAQLG